MKKGGIVGNGRAIVILAVFLVAVLGILVVANTDYGGGTLLFFNDTFDSEIDYTFWQNVTGVMSQTSDLYWDSGAAFTDRVYSNVNSSGGTQFPSTGIVTLANLSSNDPFRVTVFLEISNLSNTYSTNGTLATLSSTFSLGIYNTTDFGGGMTLRNRQSACRLRLSGTGAWDLQLMNTSDASSNDQFPFSPGNNLVGNLTYSYNGTTLNCTYISDSSDAIEATMTREAVLPTGDIAFGIENGLTYNDQGVVNASATVDVSIDNFRYYNISTANPAGGGGEVTASTAFPHPANSSFWHDIVTLNITLSSTTNIDNVTFRLQDLNDKSFKKNYTVNLGANNSNGDVHLRFNSRLDTYTQGPMEISPCDVSNTNGCNITVDIFNNTYDGTNGVTRIELNGLNSPGEAGLFTQNLLPKVMNLSINESFVNNQNFSVGALMEIRVTVNDSYPLEYNGDGISKVWVRFWNATFSYNATNLFSTENTPTSEGIYKNQSHWNGTLNISDMISAGFANGTIYNVSVMVNDTTNCLGEGEIPTCFSNINETTYLQFGIGLAPAAGPAPEDQTTLSITIEQPSPKNSTEWHDNVTLNMSTVSTAVRNVTFRIQDMLTHAFVLNFTIYNSTNNSGDSNGVWQVTFDSRNLLVDSNYNITVELYNSTYDGSTGFVVAEFIADGGANYGVQIHNQRPQANNITLAGSKNPWFNLTEDDFAGVGVRFQAVVNDTVAQSNPAQGIARVYFRMWNSSNSWNISGSTNHTVSWAGLLHKNTSLWNATWDGQSIVLSDGNYNVSVLVNDTIGCQTLDNFQTCSPNLNDTTYLTFGLDTALPAVTINTPTADTNFSASEANYTINVTVTDTDVLRTAVLFSLDNGTKPFNITATRQSTSNFWIASYNFSTLANTDIVVTALVNDSFGNQNWTQTITVVNDFITPNISVITPLNQRNYTVAVNNVNTTLNMSIKEDTDTGTNIFAALFQLDNSTGTAFNVTATNGSGYWAASYNLSNLVEGNHIITFYAEDYAGNIHNNITRSFTLDNSAPVVTITAPTNNTILTGSGNSSFTATIKDLTIQSVIFSFDNATNASFNATATNNSGTWTVSYSLAGLKNGSHTMTVLANDTFGKYNVSQIVNFNISSGSPVVSIITTADRNYTSASAAQVFNASILEANISVVTFSFDNSTGVDFNKTPTNGSGHWSTSLAIGLFTEGRHIMTVFSNDTDTNTENTKTLAFTVDNTAPNVSIEDEINTGLDKNYTIASFNQSFNASIRDLLMNSMTNVKFSFDNASGTGFNSTAVKEFTTSNSTWVLKYNVSSLAEGKHTVRIFANDTLGNTNTTQTIQFTTDNTAPNVTVLDELRSNQDRNFTSADNTNQTFNVSIRDLLMSSILDVRFSFDNSTGKGFNVTPVEEFSSAPNSSWSASYNVSNLVEGRHTVTIFSNDTVANINRTQTITYTLDNTAPNVTLLDELQTAQNKNFTTANVIINASIKDLLMNSILGVKFSFDNASGTSFNVTASEEFSTAPNSTWATAYAGSGLADGIHTVTIFANDTLGNQNATQTVQFTVDNTAPNVSIEDELTTEQDKNFTIASFNQTFNVTVRDLLMNSMTNVKFNFDNASGIGFNVTATKEFATSNSTWSAVYNVSSLADGTHIVTIFANDTLGNMNSTQTISFKVDNTAPVTDWVNVNNSNYSKTSFNKVFNVSIADLTIQSVFFSFDNGSGTAFNVTPTNGSGYWAATYNVSGLAEGNITVTVWANDTLGNLNDTAVITLTTDYTLFSLSNVTAGTPTATAVTITWNSSETANATVHYGATEALGSATSSTTRSRQHSVDLSGLTGSTAYYYNVTSCDYAGNCNTTNSSGFTTLEAAATNTGSPGGGTSTSTTTTGSDSAGSATAGKITTSAPVAAPTESTEVKQEFAQIAPAEVATINVAAASPSIGVTTVSFSVNNQVTDAFVQVAEVTQLPPEVSEFTGKAYKNLEITHSDTITNDNLVAPKIEFKVSKIWLSNNLLAADAVALHRFVDAQWSELPTILASSDNEFNYYSAQTPGFSYFIIGEKTAVVEVAQPTQEVVEKKVGFWSKVSSWWKTFASWFSSLFSGISLRDIALAGFGIIILLTGFILIWMFTKKKKKNRKK
jgi:PGF-pre-PGF domain-containing protein